MREEIIEQLKSAGVDYSGALHRFLNKEDMYAMFLKKYNSDTSVGSIRDGVSNADYEAAFKAAHTLKGLAGNLGINSVQNIASEITEQLRGKSADEIDKDLLAANVERLIETDECIRGIIEGIG